jgi:hypothetical protein
MAPSISSEVATTLRTYIDNATKGSSPTIPGAVVHIVDSQNNVLFSHRSNHSTTPEVKPVSVIHSLTKIVGAIAYLQLVEHNLTSLDDPNIITTHLPELAAKKVLTGYTTDPDGTKIWQLENRVGDITPRMLMNHTYGGGHTYMNELLLAYFLDPNTPVDWATTNELYSRPRSSSSQAQKQTTAKASTGSPCSSNASRTKASLHISEPTFSIPCLLLPWRLNHPLAARHLTVKCFGRERFVRQRDTWLLNPCLNKLRAQMRIQLEIITRDVLAQVLCLAQKTMRV